jgi:tyrosinase
VDAAVTLRFPYWDWMQTATLPSIVTQQYITVNSQFGRVSIANPLYQYRFAANGPGGPKSSDFPSSSGAPAGFAQTARQASSGGVTNNNAASSALANNAGYLHDATYQVLTKTKVYGEMANNGYPGQITGAGSLENPHGTVHNLIGGSYGHMTYLDYSAFDPIFWLHHCNVDRLFAIWQAINPNTWSINQKTDSGTFAVTAGTTETSRTPLYPFSKDSNGKLYTSDDVRKTTDLGYTYPEIRPWGKTATQNTKDVTAAIRTLYDPQNKLARRGEKMDKRSRCAGGKTPPLDPSKVVVNGRYKQWGLNMEVNKFALSASFNIFFFLGNASEDARQWAFDSHLVGSVAVLRPMGDDTPAELTIYGSIPLTRAMLDAVDTGKLKNLDVAKAVPHLQDHLQWRVAYLNGTEISISQIPSLKVYVVDQDVKQPSSITELPEYGAVTQHLNVTEGKPGSAAPTDVPSNSTIYSSRLRH